MERIKEKEMYLEMLSELVKQRRLITEEILLVRNHLDKLDNEIEQHKEYMSAAEYIGIRNSIRKELEIELRTQIRQEIKDELTTIKVEEVPSIVPTQVVAETQFKDNQNKVPLDTSTKTLLSIIKAFLKEKGVPVAAEELKAYLEENRNKTWTARAWHQLLWRLRQADERIENPMRGFYQYRV